MPNTFIPSQIGYIPTGNNAGVLFSTVVLGRDVTGSFEAAGFGANGRPDYAQSIQINLTSRASNGTLSKQGAVILDISNIIAARLANTNVPANLNLTFREVSVCDNGTNKRMMIIASQPYSAPT